MSLSSYDPYTRYRRRSLDRVKGLFFVVCIAAACFAAGVWFGGMNSAQKLNILQRQVDLDAKQRTQLEEALTASRVEAQTALMRYEQLQESVSETIPEGPMGDLVDLVKKQLDRGIDPERLSFVIRSSRPPQNCTEAEARRFVVVTPNYSGPDSAVVIGENLISITGQGASSQNISGQPEAWYDPSKRVSLEFKKEDGTMDKKSGVLPIQKSIVVGDREYRFTVSAGAKSFAKVTFDSCDYP